METRFPNYNGLGARITIISAVEIKLPTAETASVTEDTLSVDLSDGRTIAVPLAWFPRLLHASPAERKNWRLIGRGQGIHWEELDEDISVEGLLTGRPSGESQASFKRWLESRSARSEKRVTPRRVIKKIKKPGPGQGIAAILSAHERWLVSDAKEGNQANLAKVDLSGVNLTGVKLAKANLRGSILSRADLSKADLSAANLEGAILRDADLSSADLREANLDGANLGGAYLVNAKGLSGKQLSSAITDEETTMPDGSRGPFNPAS